MRLRPTLLLPTVVLLLIAFLLPILSAVPLARAAPLPANFADDLVASVTDPTALAFTPDGRLLIGSQPGKLLVYHNGALLPTAALDLTDRLCNNSERGLLGVAVDPNFASNRSIYLYYTFNKFNTCPRGRPTDPNNPVSRVSRFTLGDNNVVQISSEAVLIDNILSPNGNHNAGDLHFGKDGYLYISTGDGGCDYAGDSGCAGNNDASLEQFTLLGKILRITRDGGIPADNPYVSTGERCNVNGRNISNKPCQETWAWGLRNPFRIAFDPNASGTRFFINDVGQNKWEEIDNGVKGANYGWNVREGFCVRDSTTDCRSTPGAVVGVHTDPIHAYGREIGISITGGAFVPNGVWPATFNDDYLFGDYSGKIMRLEPNGSGGYTRSDFVTDLGSSSVVFMTFGPYNGSQALFYTTYASGGQIRRLRYTGSTNRAPTAAISASPTSGAAPLTVNFSGSGSSDPEGDALTYLWNFGDGSAVRETTTATTSYTYPASGTYNASLTVRDSKGAPSNAVTQRIDAGNTAPTPKIIAPTSTKLFRVGEVITLQGSATDAQDGTLVDSRLSWRVIQHHADHTHPFLPPTTGNNITITAPAPEDLLAATNSYLAIELTAIDSQGLSTTVRQVLRPKKVDITFDTQPSDLKIEANGTTLTGRSTITSWEGYTLSVNAPNQTISGTLYTFTGWSNGGARSHTITTPANATTYTAHFQSGTTLKNRVYLSLIIAD